MSDMEKWNRRFLIRIILICILLILLAVVGFLAYELFLHPKNPSSTLEKNSSDTSAAGETTTNGLTGLKYNVPVTFNSSVKADKGITVIGDSTFTGSFIVNGKVLTFGDQTSAITSLVGGDGITVTSGVSPQISNTGVLSVQDKTGKISFIAGSGISVDGLTFSNTDTGSAQSIFKTIAVSGQSNILAGSNTDTLTFASGPGVALTTDPATKQLTIAVAPGGLSQWTTNGTDIYYLPGNVGIGLTNPTHKLDVAGTANISGDTHFSSLGQGIAHLDSNGLLSSSKVANGELFNSSIFINPGSGISGGGNVQLGGSVTITNAGVLSDTAGTGINVSSTTGNVVITNTGVTSILGTPNQVNASPSTGVVTLSLPQDIATSSTPTFAGLSLTNTSNQLNFGTTNIGTLSWSPSIARTITLPDSTGVVCLTTGNCAGVGGSVAGTGTLNRIAKFTATGSTIGDSSIYDNGQVGIGTTTPSGLFNVSGAIAGQPLTLLNYTGTTQNILTANTSNVTKFFIGNTGNIGFTGNTSFLSTLTSAATVAQTYTFPDVTGVVCLTTGNCAGQGGVVSGTGTINYIPIWTSSTGIGISTLYQIGGNVGLGTTTPAAALDVNGSASVSGNITMNSVGSLQTTNNQTLTVGGNTSGNLLLFSNNVVVFRNPGTSNTFVGGNAGKATLTGTANTTVGVSAGGGLTSGSENVIIGVATGLSLTSGNDNTMLGRQAGNATSTGNNNTYVGWQAGLGNNTGSDNTMIGTAANPNTGALTASIAIGRGATTFANNQLVFGSVFAVVNDGYFGSGVSTNNPSDFTFNASGVTAGFTNLPGANLNFAGGKGTGTGLGGSLIFKTATPSASGSTQNTLGERMRIDSFGNVGIGTATLRFQTTINSVGNGKGILALTGDSNQTLFTASVSGATKFLIDNAGNVGIGTIATTTNPLTVGTDNTNGNGAFLSPGGSWTNGSSREFKENFTTLNLQDVLGKITSLSIPEWDYKIEGASVKHIGPIAEDFYSLFGVGNDPQHISTIDPAGIALLGIQALNQKMTAFSQNSSLTVSQTDHDTLTTQTDAIATLQNSLRSLTDRISMLEKTSLPSSPISASLSAQLTGVSLNIDKNATISGTLVVQGRTLMNDLGVTGTITNGLLSINGLAGTIDVIGQPLKLQSLGVGSIDILAGKVTIDTKGNIMSKGAVTATKYNVDTSDPTSASLGSGVLKEEMTASVINTSAVTAKSKIFVTPRDLTGGQVLVAEGVIDGKSFTVKIEKSYTSDIPFDWWIVN